MTLVIPSLSMSSSQASPMPSPSLSSWPEFGMVGQLSARQIASRQFKTRKKNELLK